VTTALSNIVVPVDFSSNATLALAEAAALARRFQAHVTVVYVVPQVIFHPEWTTEVEDTLAVHDITEEARQALRAMTAPYRQEGLHITETILAGGPYVEIVRLAARLGADLIVIGAHGTSGRQPALMGSVAERVVREAPCSVLTVRAPRQRTGSPCQKAPG